MAIIVYQEKLYSSNKNLNSFFWSKIKRINIFVYQTRTTKIEDNILQIEQPASIGFLKLNGEKKYLSILVQL